MDEHRKQKSFSPELRERAVGMVQDHRGDYASEWAAIVSIAGKIGCTSEMLRRWLRQSAGAVTAPDGISAEMRERLQALERESRELRQANEILRNRRDRRRTGNRGSPPSGRPAHRQCLGNHSQTTHEESEFR